MTELFSRKKAADYINVETQTLKNWAHRRVHLPYILVGRLAKYAKDDLDAYLKKRKTFPHNHSYI